MRIAICDDEKLHLFNIEKYLFAFRDTVQYVTECFYSGEELVSSYKKGNYFDIIFLDIKMNEMNGIETAKEVRKMDGNVLIIFVTYLLEYVFQGYEVRAFRYLMKPIQKEQFEIEFIRALQEYYRIKDSVYTIRIKDLLIKLDYSEVILLESDRRKIRLITYNKEYSFYGNISEEEKNLKDKHFIRVHRCILVNMAYVKAINKKFIVLNNNNEIPVSKSRHKEVYDQFVKYLARHNI